MPVSSATTQAEVSVGSRLVLQVVNQLRHQGLPVSTVEALDAITSLATLTTTDLTKREYVKLALKTCLVKDDSHDIAFTRAFNSIFPRMTQTSESVDGTDGTSSSLAQALRDGDQGSIDSFLESALSQSQPTKGNTASEGQVTQRALRRMNITDLYSQILESDSSATKDLDRAIDSIEANRAIEQMRRRMADLAGGRIRDSSNAISEQAIEDPEDRPLLKAGPDELAAMRQAMRPLARKLATKLGNKRRQGYSGLDMRKTIRSSMGFGGIPVSPIMRRRRPTKPDLYVLCDVSGSTASFAPFTLTLLHALHEEFRRVRSFVFIDGVVEITELLEKNPGVLDPHHLLANRGLIVNDGRSDYRLALNSFIEQWGESVTAKSTVLIAGDARSHDRDPATSAIAELDHRARRLYWFNPEPMTEWDTLDSHATNYARHCTAAFEVSTLRGLMDAVTHII